MAPSDPFSGDFRGTDARAGKIMHTMVTPNQLQELVDAPNETLDVEYKTWLDLARNTEAKADTARHLAALANYGGGRLVFGFNDDMSFSGPNPFPNVVYDRDLFAGLVKRYLEPTFQCDVHTVTSALGNEHPVVVVPPHGSVPICAKASGPDVNGKPKGIVQGTYYTRKPGPESAPILTPAEWHPIIRRCAMHERAAILGAIDTALRGAGQLGAPATGTLKAWHDAAHAVFLRDIAERNAPAELEKWHFQLSYSIECSEFTEIDPNQLTKELQDANNEVRDLVRSGWSLFYQFSRSGIEPYFTTDPSVGHGEKEFLECALLRDPQKSPFITAYDMWRIALDGKATQIREYWEDNPELNTQRFTAPGTWFSPNAMAQLLGELVRHARAMAERFNSATAVAFRCEWHGLGGRRLFDPRARWFPDQISRNDHAVAVGTWPISTLTGNWPDIVAKLGGPVMRGFGNNSAFTPEWVLAQAPRWLQ